MKHVVLIVLSFLVLLLSFQNANATVIDDVNIVANYDSYEVRIQLLTGLRYKSHTPSKLNDRFHITLALGNRDDLDNQEVLDSLREEISLPWDKSTGAPISDMFFEGLSPEEPTITINLTEDANIDVRSSSDFKELIITIKPRAKHFEKKAYKEKQKKESLAITPSAPEIAAPTIAGKSGDNKIDGLVKRAQDAINKKQYKLAVELYTRLVRVAPESTKKKAHELLGLARENAGQVAFAKKEYSDFLKKYPKDEDYNRVKQRLAGLVTATKGFRTLRKKKIAAGEKVKSKWWSQYYGSVAQIYSRNQVTPEDGKTVVNRSDLSNTANLSARWRSDRYNVRARFDGSYNNDFLDSEDNQERISTFSVEVQDNEHNAEGRVGRQLRNTGGILGRFDGVYAGYEFYPKMKANLVLGYPVESTKVTEVNTDKKVSGLSVDFKDIYPHWDLTTFAVNQTNEGLTDRRAIGTEVRYFDPEKSLFNLIDYDVHHDALSIFMLSGNWTLPRKDTTLNFIYDFRKSPLLMTNNAIQGQGVEKISELFGTYTEDELFQLAQDRSSDTRSATAGVTHDINKDMQITGEMTLSRTSSTPASGGVDMSPSSGTEYYYSSQLVTNNVFFPNDSFITGVRYSDTQSTDVYSLILSNRVALMDRKLRLRSRFRTDYRADKDSNDNRLTLRPFLRADYKVRKWASLEAEGGFEWVDEENSGLSTSSLGSFISAGYRINF